MGLTATERPAQLDRRRPGRPTLTPPGERRQRGWRLAVKRTFDVVGAALLLVLAAPLMLAAEVVVALTSTGSPRYFAQRVGRGGRRFRVRKLRSMRCGCSDDLHEGYLHALLTEAATPAPRRLYKLDHDPRVTTVGRFLRATSVDELPQLLNVLRGEMSLVGPRPECPYALADYEPWMWRRFDVLPGLTGLWQVEGRANLTPRQMLALDVQYADEWTLWSDVRILLRTPAAVLRRVGSG